MMKHFLVLCVLILTANCGTLFGQTKIELQPTDTVGSILQRSVGQTVELRMTSGEKMGGKVEKVGDKLVHLTQLSGAEFFDGVVDLSDVAAVIVRARSK